jgi:hypothetical protein
MESNWFKEGLAGLAWSILGAIGAYMIGSWYLFIFGVPVAFVLATLAARIFLDGELGPRALELAKERLGIRSNERVATARLANPPSVVAAEPPRRLSTYEIEQKLKRYDDLLEFIRDQTGRIAVEGNQIRSGPWQMMKGGAEAFRERCLDYRNDVTSLTNRIEGMRAANAHHPDVQSVLPKNDDLAKFANAVTAFERALEKLWQFKELTEPNFHFLLEPREQELTNHVRQFARWRNEATAKLIQMRKNVSG